MTTLQGRFRIGVWLVFGVVISSGGCSEPASEGFGVSEAELTLASNDPATIGQEVAIPRHLQDGEEYTIGIKKLLRYGRKLFLANWTSEEGAGRPFTTGTGGPLRDNTQPLLFPRNFNRVSAPDANSCTGCHNAPRPGGAGDIVANVFVTAQRFDFLTFDNSDTMPGRGSMMENGAHALLQNVGAFRNTVGMNGAGYIELLARHMTADLQAIRDTIAPGGSAALTTLGVDFGVLARAGDGTWDTSGVEGLTPMSLGDGSSLPSLVIRPFHQASAVVSLREFSNNAFNHHHGIQTTERFGIDTDPDGDGFQNEMTRADVTAVALFQAVLAVPGRVIPKVKQIEKAIRRGEQLFVSAQCASCHVPTLSLPRFGSTFSEPNPYNPPGNLQVGDAPDVTIDLNHGSLPRPRLHSASHGTDVPAYTDLKLHDITCGPGDANREPVNMHFSPAQPEFFQGNGRFLTRKLWGVASEAPYFHHGQFTTLREAVDAHCGEAMASRNAWGAMSSTDQDALIEFLKSLRILPQGTNSRIVDEQGRARSWSGLP